MQSYKKKEKEKDIGYFERAVISNGYFERAVTSYDANNVIGLLIFSMIFY
jgi:hypothetical protein